jgi:hypothetical protein
MGKKLYRVAIEGEVWVMAESPHAACNVANNALGRTAEDVELYVYPMLPVNPALVDAKVLKSLPYNADRGDRRTVGEHLIATRARTDAAVPPITWSTGTPLGGRK